MKEIIACVQGKPNLSHTRVDYGCQREVVGLVWYIQQDFSFRSCGGLNHYEIILERRRETEKLEQLTTKEMTLRKPHVMVKLSLFVMVLVSV